MKTFCKKKKIHTVTNGSGMFEYYKQFMYSMKTKS